MDGGKLYLDLVEAYYLVEKGKLSIEGEKDILTNVKEERDFAVRFFVYKDLRDRGRLVKAGFKYGAHFRVYCGGIESHAEYLIQAIDEKESLQSYEIAQAARMANTVNKKMILAFVDMENDITYIDVKRIRL